MTETDAFETNLPEEEEYYQFTVKKSSLLLGLLPIFFILGLFTGFLIWGRGDTLPTPTAISPTTQAADSAVETPTRYEVEISPDDPVLGPEDAPITIIEFSDYQCPYCRRHFLETSGQIFENYEGLVRLVFKDFPLTNIHPQAVSAAAAALCAKEQDAYWEFHDLLFEMSLEFSNDTYLAYAESLGLKMDAFSECVSENRYEQRVNDNLNYGINFGVRSTPTFFINGIAVVGAQPFSVFQEIIDAELALQN